MTGYRIRQTSKYKRYAQWNKKNPRKNLLSSIIMGLLKGNSYC